MKFVYFLKNMVLFTGFLAILLIILEQLWMLTFYISVPGRRNKENINREKTDSRNKKIIFWTKFFSRYEFMPDSFADLECKIGYCDITLNRSLLSESDAIVLHWLDVNMNDLPRKQTNSRIVLLNLECPRKGFLHKSALPKFQPIVDWVVSYRLDSDIYTPYGSVKRRNGNDTFQKPHGLDTEFKSKRLVAWMVSNCDASSGRREIVNELISHGLEVDEYGACPYGNKSLRKAGRHEAYQFLAKRYKFYLAFENGLCRDYVSEKLYQSLHKGMVPVVFGGANYRMMLPENSFIDVLDFTSLKELANYLMVLGKTERLYSLHHEWRMNYNAYANKRDIWTSLCNLCEQLQNPSSVTKKRNADLMKWWNDGNDCVDPAFRNGKLIISKTRERRNGIYSNTE